jgi:hypothetical protein
MKIELYIGLLAEKQQAWLSSSLTMEEALLAKNYECFFSGLEVRGQIISSYQDLLKRLVSNLEASVAGFSAESVLPFILQNSESLGISMQSVDKLQNIKQGFVDLRFIEERISRLADTLPVEIENKLKLFQGKRGMVQAYDRQKLQLANLYHRFEKRH